MDKPTQYLVLKTTEVKIKADEKYRLLKSLKDKSERHLITSPTRAMLSKRIHQVTGMVELIKQLPGYGDLVEPLEQHQQWLERKIKAWPI
jgi:hypothetical protein